MTDEAKPEHPVDEVRERLLFAVRCRYDLQQLRMQSANRAGKHATRIKLTDEDQALLSRISDGLLDLEKDTVNEIKTRLKGIPVYERWLRYQRGIGPVLAGVLLGCIDIHRATKASSIWAYAGLAVDADGHAVRRRKGQKVNYDPWFKAKMLKVMGESFIKSNSPWRIYYDNRKHRTSSMRMQCRACDGTGKYKGKPAAEAVDDAADVVGAPAAPAKDEPKPGSPCKNCEGTGTGPWGRSAEHRALDATRYMVKMFLAALYDRWRTLEGLPVRASYQEQYLGHVHRDDFPWQTLDGPAVPNQPPVEDEDEAIASRPERATASKKPRGRKRAAKKK